jgi:hypothetical protein
MSSRSVVRARMFPSPQRRGLNDGGRRPMSSIEAPA